MEVVFILRDRVGFQFHNEGTSYVGLTLCINGAMVSLNYVFHIAQAEAKPFYIMNVSSGYSKQAFKDLAKKLFRNSKSLVTKS